MYSMLLTAEAEAAKQAQSGSMVATVVMLVFWVAIMYFLMIRPQKKQQKQMDALRDAIQPGDNIMTTGGFYGVVLDVVDDTVIVEFGNNKNCRIPMHKNAIAEVEKEDDAVEDEK